jgi:NAD(P)-dependent dehydrogenase (short-subunit alcohol dehydrogenase family)
MELKDRICLITGGTKGIGAAAAIGCAERGASVVVVGRNRDEEATRTLQRLEEIGSPFVFIAADIGKPEEATRCVEQTAERFGTVDVLVHSAGGPVNGGLLALTPEAWYEAFNVHVHPIFHLCRAAIPHMRQRKEGVIVLISSTAGIRGIKTNVAYQTVKGALPQLTRALAYEFAEDNIRVNCVAPGVIRTAFHAQMPPEVKKNNLENRIPLHREGTPEQVGTLILEMVTNDYITGETFTIDGGLTMRIA